MSTLTFRQAVPRDADRCFEIESTAYEGDEAATLAKIRKRIADYPQGFLVMECDAKTIGFINIKPSASDHGGMSWHEMVMEL